MCLQSTAHFFRATLLSARFSWWQFVWTGFSGRGLTSIGPSRNLHRVQLRDSRCVATAFERCFQPHSHNFQCETFWDHPLADRKNIRVVVLARKPGGFFVPAKRATHTVNFVRCHRLAVPRSAENDAALTFATCDEFGCRPNEKRIIDRVFAERAAIFHFMP